MKPVIEPEQNTENIALDASLVREALLPPVCYNENSILSAAGVFKDDPEFAALIARVYERRKHMDKDEASDWNETRY